MTESISKLWMSEWVKDKHVHRGAAHLKKMQGDILRKILCSGGGEDEKLRFRRKNEKGEEKRRIIT